MKLFRLVLCLAGLAVYLVVRPGVETTSSPKTPASPPVSPEASKAKPFTVEVMPDEIAPAGSPPESSMVR